MIYAISLFVNDKGGENSVLLRKILCWYMCVVIMDIWYIFGNVVIWQCREHLLYGNIFILYAGENKNTWLVTYLFVITYLL